MKISQSQTAGRCVVNFTKGPEMSLVEEFHALSWQQRVEPPRDQEIFGIYFNFSRLQTRLHIYMRFGTTEFLIFGVRLLLCSRRVSFISQLRRERISAF